MSHDDEYWSDAHAHGVCRGATLAGRGCPLCYYGEHVLPAERTRQERSTAIALAVSPRRRAAMAAVEAAVDRHLDAMDRHASAVGGDGDVTRALAELEAATVALCLADDERAAALGVAP